MNTRWSWQRLVSPLPTLVLLAASVPPLAAAPPPAGGDAGAVVATVNGRAIYLEDLEGRLDEMHGTAGEGRRGAFDLDQLMFRLVNDALLAQEARALGMDSEPPIPERRAELARELAVRRLEREEIWSKADATDAEVRAAFEAQYRRVTLRVLTTYEEGEARKALDELRTGADFAALATERSKDPYGPRGGLVESLPRADLQRSIAEAAFSSKPGKLFGPIVTDIGWAVLRVESFEPPDETRFEAVQKDIRDTVRFGKAEGLRAALQRRLREKYPVTVDRKVEGSIRPERLPDGRLSATAPEPEAPVARFGGPSGSHAITAGAYVRALVLRWSGVHNEVAAQAAAPIVLDRLIGDELLATEAVARGYGDTPEVRRRVRALETRLLVARYLQEVVAQTIQVKPEAMRAYYEAHKEGYHKPPHVFLSQITLGSRAEAEKVVELARGGADFAWLARQHSIDNLRQQGGAKGWTTPRPGVGGLDEELLAARVGDVLGPAGSEAEWVVYRVGAREEQGLYSFQEVSGNVRAAVYQEAARKAIDGVVSKLRERSKIEIYHDVLDHLRISGQVEADESAEGAVPAGHGHGTP